MTGLELTEAGEPTWHLDVSSPAFAESLGDLLAQLHSVDPAAAEATGIESKTPEEVREAWHADIARVATASTEAFARTVDRYLAGGGRVWPRLAEHCAEMLSASPVAYGIYAQLKSVMP